MLLRFGANAAYHLHDRTHDVIKAHHFGTHCLLVNDSMVMQRSWKIRVTFAGRNKTCVRAQHRGGSVVTGTNFSNGTFFL